jgi:UDP-N-acetylglucosamine--N-acetylmuramyl-(pentapeptide) pyrophosphoryl-undecaprenol N-acetylglucosamine transferase
VASLVAVPTSLAQAALLLWRLRPQVVLGLGGYASGPVVLAAALMRRPTAVMEQNSVPGSTNRLLARLGVLHRAYLSFEASRSYFRASTVRVLGNPVRQAITDVGRTPVPTEPLRLLVLGGSQGAEKLNRAVPDGLSRVVAATPGITVTHQTGDAMVEAVRRRYDDLGVKARVVSFIDDMASAYRQASLVICRAGATTLAELAVVGRPSLLVPFPYAIDDHQRKNAEEFVRTGAASMVLDAEVTPERIADEVSRLVAQPDELLPSMGQAARRWGRPDATAQVVSDLEELINVSR